MTYPWAVGVLSFVRLARRVTGWGSGQEYRSLEALLEAEAGEPTDDYRIAAWAVSGTLLLTTIGLVVAAVWMHSALLLLWPVISALLGIGAYLLFDHMDKQIPKSRARLRKQAKQVLTRYSSLANLVGVAPALSPQVATVLDQACEITLKHLSTPTRRAQSEPQAVALSALEDALARMFDLAKATSVEAQDAELSRGWAQPLLDEMRQLDRSLERHRASVRTHGLEADDPLARLREARLELQRSEAAIEELDQEHLST